MKNLFVFGIVLISLLSLSMPSQAQIGELGYNPLSIRADEELRYIYGQPIYEADVMYRTTLWRKINLKEKQNLPFFSQGNEITALIIRGVREGKITPYDFDGGPSSDGVSNPIELEDFEKKIEIDDPDIGVVPAKPREMSVLEIREDLIFDKRRSRMYYDIQTVTVFIEAAAFTDGGSLAFDRPVATFKFSDLYRYFKEIYDQSQYEDRTDDTGRTVARGGTAQAVRGHWVNPYNPRRHMSLADAFELRLFSSRIVKVINPEDKNLVEIISDEYPDAPDKARRVLELSQQYEYDLMEYEHNLWEF
ncbi:hypothetical protein [Eisenibacter elegans]|uniref:hypothetical protein n=1 Tax=Eisenibacter elegans TaxID=997 RepID=UPI0003F96D15|nr:hypothetical protein [Eisenibacter elegans]